MKTKVSFVCQECGYDTASYLGKCPECGAWNSLKEIHITKAPALVVGKSNGHVSAKTLDQIASTEKTRILTGFLEFDTVLGGGIVKGSVGLLAGDPGVGKSTLLLQLALNIASPSPSALSQREREGVRGKKVLYVSGEESEEQIKIRADRLMANSLWQMEKKKTKIDPVENLLILSVSDPDEAIGHIQNLRPDFVVVDSIQTMQSENVAGLSGSIGQVRYSALHFIRSAKHYNIPMILVGHVTKEGMVAGPMVLSHMVDLVLFLEGEKFSQTRILRSLKNRFGPVDEVGLFQMGEGGISELKNPEALFLNQKRKAVSGSALVITMEGTRPFIIELQALAVYSKLPMPRRVISGLDPRRVELLLAVLQKHCLLPVDSMDVFVNVVGGMKLSDPGVDLGICLAVFSSLKNISISDAVGIAEVGLLGELRPPQGGSLQKRIKEARKLGFTHIISNKTHETLRDALNSFGNRNER